MFGKNPISKPVNHDGNKLEVVNIFKTLQGEGPYAGYPAIFIRLGGCNLQCKFCDTEFDNFKEMNLEGITEEVTKLVAKDNIPLIVISGGEPLRQPIEKLCKTLLKAGYKVQIETNGTIRRELPKKVHIVCSPKIKNKKYYISKDLLDYADCFKFLISKKGEYSKLPKLDTSKPIYIQPIDSYNNKENLANQKYTMELALKHGYIYSMQQHKILNIE